ncbi:MAG: J domain-containing protein [Desulfobacterales bacterium]|nr:J domain-containing protein [Desulfobacterales bacterium]
MDMKQALDIFNLAHDSYLEDAKASFRTLAKQYHPDKLNINDTKCNAHKKMKEINLAFHILKKNLKPKEISRPKQNKPIKTATATRTSSFHGLEALFKKIHKKFFKTTKTKHTKSQSSNTFEPTTKARNFVKKKKTFDSVLNKTIKNSLNISLEDYDLKSSGQIKSKQKINSKNTYSKYMQLNKKMRSKRKHVSLEGFAPIEKISPISPIKKS